VSQEGSLLLLQPVYRDRITILPGQDAAEGVVLRLFKTLMHRFDTNRASKLSIDPEKGLIFARLLSLYERREANRSE